MKGKITRTIGIVLTCCAISLGGIWIFCVVKWFTVEGLSAKWYWTDRMFVFILLALVFNTVGMIFLQGKE